MNMSRLPTVKACRDNIMKEGISDDDLVRNFLIVALVTFLCPNSNVHPSTEYLKPLVHIKKAEGWDWSKFVHYWLFKQIKKFNNERKKKDIQATKTMGGCLFVLCVVYIDFLKIGQQQLPPTLPRISVFKSDMIKQMAKLDCVQGHTYGKCHVLPFKSTCYYKQTGVTTPSPTCVNDGATFKKTLTEAVHGSLSPKTVNDVTELYMKYSAGNVDSASETAQNIIVDVISYFHQRAQSDKRASGGNGDDTQNIQEDIDCDMDGNVSGGEELPADDAHAHVDGYGEASAARDDCSGNTVIIPLSSADRSSASDSITETVKVSESLYGTTDQLDSSQGVGSQAKRRRLSTSPASANIEYGGSTVAERTRSRRHSFTSHAAANITHHIGFVDNPESILRKKNVKRVVSRSRTQPEKVPEKNSLIDDDDVIFCGYFPSQQLSLKVLASLPGDGPSDNSRERLEALKRIVNKGLKDRQAKHGNQPLPNSNINAQRIHDDERQHEVNFSNNSADAALQKDRVSFGKLHDKEAQGGHIDASATQECPEMSASFSHMLGSDISSHKSRNLDPPSVNLGSKTSETISMMDIPAPSFRLLEEFDDNDNFIENPRKRRAVGLSCDGETIYGDPTCFSHPHEEHTIPILEVPSPIHRTSQPKPTPKQSIAEDVQVHSINADHAYDSPIFDRTPHGNDDLSCEVSPLAAIDVKGRFILLSSQESPATPEVQITGFKNFNASCSTMGKEVDYIYNETGVSCFKKCAKIGFNLGSSSAGKQPRCPQRLIQPNSYYRNFQTNICNVKFSVSTHDLLAYDCILFYASQREYASLEVINYDNVRVSYQQLSTLRRSSKVSVDKFVINAFCRKLFKDKHPKDSRRHFFFSTVGDYLMSHEWNQTFFHDTCRKCFTLANGCFKFTSSDYIPNFVKAWDEFIGIDWDFQDFVIHYAPVPKLDLKFFSKYDDGIFVMKFLELWDPRVNLIQKFSSSNIPDIRVQYMNSMVFSPHNCNSDAKDMVRNHTAMMELRKRSGFQPSSTSLF